MIQIGLVLFVLSYPIEMGLDWWWISAPMFYVGVLLMCLGLVRKIWYVRYGT